MEGLSVASIGMEAETMAMDDLTNGEHVDGKEKRSKHRTLGHAVVNWSRGSARAFHGEAVPVPVRPR